MRDNIYRNSLSAWNALSEIGGLEISGRDVDLATALRDRINPNASDLTAALRSTPTEVFLQALFQVVQPFALMFRDVLNFFERAGAREGQTQWKVSIGNKCVDFRHFEEFLEHWNNIECDLEIPAIDMVSAFLPNEVRLATGDSDYLLNGVSRDGLTTGIEDVDAWLTEYAEGRYAPFPRNLYPDKLEPGLDDTARIVIAALSVIKQQGVGREEMLAQHRLRSHRCEEGDALHPWTIAQNETDYWLRSCVQYLAVLLTKSEEERSAFGAKLAKAYEKFPRRRMCAHMEAQHLERLLSLPAWKKRHELYGVWVATEIVEALEDHAIAINHVNGELKFAFAEAKIVDVTSARPRVSIFCERRSPLADPVGKGRVSSVQPDYGIWTSGSQPDDCILVVEVKHYKERSRQNFREALIDYARAHHRATVVLVNYGPVGSDFADLPHSINNRCIMIGYLNPENKSARDRFRDIVRTHVGDPVVSASYMEPVSLAKVVVVDISQSMSGILESDWFLDFIVGLKHEVKYALVDSDLRAFLGHEKLKEWLIKHEFGGSTSLSDSVSQLLKEYEHLVVVTDHDGIRSLNDLDAMITELNVDDGPNVRILQVFRADSH